MSHACSTLKRRGTSSEVSLICSTRSGSSSSSGPRGSSSGALLSETPTARRASARLNSSIESCWP